MKPYNHTSDKKVQVEQMFDNIAPRYDLLNRLLSLGIDRGWRKRLIRKIQTNEPNPQILDVACGTADLSIMIKRALPQTIVTGCDLSQRMVEVGLAKISKLELDIDLLTADAEHLPFADNQFDATTCSFGVRNFGNLQNGVNEMFRVLKPGGQVLVLEFSTPKNSFFAKVFKFYFHHILPTIGGWISGDKKAYTYLPLSVDEFPCGQKFIDYLAKAGFTQASYKSLTFGVATLYTATK